MQHIIAGTAGHIDHGKTALVRALTGIDTDRLEEEKRRGISIDLGFAHLTAGGVRIGFVDVPGHERFVKNMLAGTGGIDLVMLVVAADESIKPQTREHFDICRLLRIPRGIVVLTKTDLAGPEMVELVRMEVEEFVRGSFLEGAPVIAVSAKTGEGLDELKRALEAAARGAAKRDASRPFRLPIDRSFSMRGFGTVVTGTLASGSVKVEGEVEAIPGGRRARVRGIQVHGEAVGEAFAGERTALNLAGVEPSDLRRGMTLAEPGRFEEVHVLDAELEMLTSAPKLKARAPVHFHAGTAEVEAEIRRIGSSGVIEPGTLLFARIRLREPLLILPGDRFVLRMFSPVVTIAGGQVLDIAPPRKVTAERCRRLLAGESLAVLVAESIHGVRAKDAARRLGIREADAAAEARRLNLLQLGDWLTSEDQASGFLARTRAALEAHHRAQPLSAGLAKEDVRSREGLPADVFERLLQRDPSITTEGDLLRLAGHRVALKHDEEAAARNMEEAFAKAGLTVPAVNEVLARSGVDAARARTLLQILLKQGRVIRVGEGLMMHVTAIAPLRAALVSRKGQRFSVTEFKDWTGVSRKYAIPLLEYFDRERVTRREGDSRVVI